MSRSDQLPPSVIWQSASRPEALALLQWGWLLILYPLIRQVSTGSYDLDANLALLRHYNFSPDKAHIGCLARLLIKAQMRLPAHDFAQMLHLVPERVQVLSPPRCLHTASVMIHRMAHACACRASTFCSSMDGWPGRFDGGPAHGSALMG